MSSSPDGAVGDATRTTRPALDVLDRDQDRVLYEGDTTRHPEIQPLVDGFETYWMAVVWYQAAAVRTLGHVERVLKPADFMPESGVMDHLLRPRATRDSAYVRTRLVEALDDACDLAYRQFRERANERIGTDETTRTYDQVDPEKEKNPLMRPAFRKMDQQQVGALESLWVGFDDRQALGQWVRGLAMPSHGNKPQGLMAEIVASAPLLEALLDQESVDAQLTRYRFAVDVVLPQFLDAARSLHGGEHTDAATQSHGAFNS